MKSENAIAPLAEIFFRVKGEVRALDYAIKNSDNNQVLLSRIKLKKLILRLNDSLVHHKKNSIIDYLFHDASHKTLKLAETMLYNASHYLSNCLLNQL